MGEVEKCSAAELTDLASEINCEHHAFSETASKALEHAIRAGDLLSRVKEDLPHGAFGSWLVENFEGSQRTAQDYMRMYRHRDELRAKAQHAADLSIRGALRELSPPEEAGAEGLSLEEKAVFDAYNATTLFVFSDHAENLLSAISEEHRRGALAEAAFKALLITAERYARARDEVHSDLIGYLEAVYGASRSPHLAALIRRAVERTGRRGAEEDEVGPEDLTEEERAVLREVYPKKYAGLMEKADVVRWWIDKVEWLESTVRAVDLPPSRSREDLMSGLTEEEKHYTLSKLCALGHVHSPALRVDIEWGFAA